MRCEVGVAGGSPLELLDGCLVKASRLDGTLSKPLACLPAPVHSATISAKGHNTTSGRCRVRAVWLRAGILITIWELEQCSAKDAGRRTIVS